MRNTLALSVALAACAALINTTLTQAAPPKTAPAIQKVTLTLPRDNKLGAAKVQAGHPVALTFFLQSNAGYGNEVMVPAAKWKKTLKVGEKATVTFTPKKSGPLAFSCGMNHFRGSIIVD